MPATTARSTDIDSRRSTSTRARIVAIKSGSAPSATAASRAARAATTTRSTVRGCCSAQCAAGFIYRPYLTARSNHVVSTGPIYRGAAARLPASLIALLISRKGLCVHSSIAKQAAKEVRELGFRSSSTWPVCHTHVPLGVDVRCRAMEAGFGRLLEADQAKVRPCVCSLEAGSPRAWCTALPSARRWSKLYRRIVVGEHVVPSGEQRRLQALGSWNASRPGEEE